MLDPIGVSGYANFDLVSTDATGTLYRCLLLQSGATAQMRVFNSPLPDGDRRQRFLQRCRLLATLGGHPNVARVLDYGIGAWELPYVVLQDSPGGNLAERLGREGALPAEVALPVGVKLAGAVATAHRLGLVHGGISPEAVALSADGEPLLADFRLVDGPSAMPGAGGARVPLSVAPEVLSGAEPGTAADVYSLGATIYTVLNGAPPYSPREGEPAAVTLKRITETLLPPLDRSDLPGSVMDTLERAMAKNPDDRFPSATGVGEGLRSVEEQMGLTVTGMHVADESDLVPRTQDLRPTHVHTVAPAPAAPPAPGLPAGAVAPPGMAYPPGAAGIAPAAPYSPPAPVYPPRPPGPAGGGRTGGRQGWLIVVLSVAAAAVLVGVLIGIRSSGRHPAVAAVPTTGATAGPQSTAVASTVPGSTLPPSSGSAARQPAPVSLLQKVESVPTPSLVTASTQVKDLVGARAASGGPLTAAGKPEVLYIGGEFCSFCAAERWPMVIALSKFGTFFNLSVTSTDQANGNLPTFTFYGSTYASQYLSFVGVEEFGGRQGPAYAVLQQPTSEESSVWQANEGSSESLPFVDIGGRYVLETSQYDGLTLIGQSLSSIESAIGDNSTPVGSHIDAAAAVFTKYLCSITGQQPSDVCSAVASVELPGGGQ